MDQITRGWPILALRETMADIPELHLQDESHQGRHKLSFRVECSQLAAAVRQVEERLQRAGAPYSVVDSFDAFTGEGFIDLLPRDVSKAYALRWWSEATERKDDLICFAGDSGNDFAALTAGYRTILVANADDTLVEEVRGAHARAGWADRLWLADEPSTSGVLQGCRWFGIV